MTWTPAASNSATRPCVGARVGHQRVDPLDRADPRERVPAQLRRVRDDDHPPRPRHHQGVHAGFALVVRRRAEPHVDRVGAEQRDVERHLVQDRPAERPDQFERLRSHDATGHHDLHAGADEQLVGDVQGVRHDGELRVVDAAGQLRTHRQRAGHLGRRGAAVECHHHAGRDQGRGRRADALLLGRVLGRLVPQRQVVGDAARHRTTAGPGDHLLLCELVEVAPDGGMRDLEPLGRLLDAHPTVFGEHLQQRVPARVPVHSGLPGVRQCRTLAQGQVRNLAKPSALPPSGGHRATGAAVRRPTGRAATGGRAGGPRSARPRCR